VNPSEIDHGAGGPEAFPWVCKTCSKCWWYQPGDKWQGPGVGYPCCYDAWNEDGSLGKEENVGAAFARALSRSAFERGRAVGRAEGRAAMEVKS